MPIGDYINIAAHRKYPTSGNICNECILLNDI